MNFRNIIPFFLLLSIGLVADTQTIAEHNVSDIILYRDQALVTRTVEINLGAGSHEIILSNLPSEIIPHSLFAESKDANIRAVRLRTKEVAEEADPAIKELNDKIDKIVNEIAKLEQLKKVNKEKSDYLKSQENFVVTTEKLELSRGLLKPNTIQKLTLFNFEQKKAIAEEEFTLNSEVNRLSKEKNLLIRQRNQLSRPNLKVREALVFIDKTLEDKSILRLSYLVGNSGWSPSYNFKASKQSNQVTIEFNARIHQVSGENWDNVNLVLSNGSPTLSAVVPGLSPFRVSLKSGAMGKLSYNNLEEQTKSISNKLNQASQQQMRSGSMSESKESNWAMNRAVNEYQNLELLAEDDGIQVLQKKTSQELSFPSANFELKSKVSLSSKRDPQLLKVESFDLPAKFYHIASPLLTGYVFREAEIENNNLEVLLEGPVDAYLDNRFVGKGEVTNVSKGQFFIMGFGIDSQMKAKRQLIEKKEKILGGNKEISFTVRISIQNFYKKDMDLRVMDRIPAPEEKETFRVTIDTSNSPLSTDELYNLNEKPRGILRWDINTKADSVGGKAKTIEYTYKLEYDKNMQLSLPNKQDQEMRMEFDEIQKMRYTK